MNKCPVCGKMWEPCYLCRQGERHQKCVYDSMCHDCIMEEKYGSQESDNTTIVPNSVLKVILKNNSD